MPDAARRREVAALAQSPVFGGRLKRVDDTATKAVRGVRQGVRDYRDAAGVLAPLVERVAADLAIRVDPYRPRFLGDGGDRDIGIE